MICPRSQQKWKKKARAAFLLELDPEEASNLLAVM